MDINRRQFLKFMGVAMVTIALPSKWVQGVCLPPQTQSKTIWCERCKCFHTHYSWEERLEMMHKEAARKLAEAIDNEIIALLKSRKYTY